MGFAEPLNDEVEAVKQYVKAKEKGSVKLIPLEEVKKGT